MSDRIKLPADKDGFLIGQPLDGQADKLLAGIKGDTSAILKLLASTRPGKRGREGVATASPAGRSAMREAVAAVAAAMPATVAPGGRAAVPRTQARDPVTGHFMASPAAGLAGKTAAARQQQSAADVADASQAVARSIEQQRRDDKADKASGQNRRSNGQFGNGDGPGGLRGLLGGLLGSVGSVSQGTEQIDPLLAAIGEARGAASAVAGVVSPLGRAGKSIFGTGSSVEDQPRDGMLRRVWRELRAMRKADAKASKDTLRGLKDVKEATGAGAGSGPGLLSSLVSKVPGLGAVIPGAGKLASGAATGAAVGAKAMLKRLPIVGALFEAITGVVEDQRIAADKALSDEQKRQQRGENAGGSVGAIGGAAAGAALGTVVMPGIGTVLGGIGGALAGSGLGKKVGGWVSGLFESGKSGAGAVSSGKGDAGGKSYGTHQLSSKAGTLDKFLASSPYGAQFAGMAPGSPQFDAKWKALAASDPGFANAQHGFIKSTHVDPMMSRLAAAGMDLSGRGDAVKESVWSTATQFGGNSDLIQRALSGRNLATMSDSDVVGAIQDHKIRNNSSLFRSSDVPTQMATLNRAINEKALLQGLATAGPQAPAIPRLPASAAPYIPGPVPQVDIGGGGARGAAPAPAVVHLPAAPAGQDVRDRTIAHIASGGIGGPVFHR